MTSLNRKNLAWIIALILILAAGLFVRVYDLKRDPPGNISPNSQDLITDPHHLTSFAANHEKFDRSEIYEYPRWQVFKVYLVSGTAYLLFTLAGVSRITAGLAGVIPGYIGLLLFIAPFLFRRDKAPPDFKAASLAGIFLMLGFALVTYNRAPFMESGLIFYLGLVWFLFISFKDNPINVAVLGFLIAAACLTGKLFGLSLGIAMGLVWLLQPTRRLRNTGLFIISFLVGGAILFLILYGSRGGAYIGYLYEQAFSSHGGVSRWSQGPLEIIRHLFIYGSNSGLIRNIPFLSLAFLIVSLRLYIVARRDWHAVSFDRIIWTSLLWLALLDIMFVPGNYRPLRYAILYYIPMALLVAKGYDFSPRTETKSSRPLVILADLIAVLLSGYLLTHLVLDLFLWDDYTGNFWMVFVPALIAAMVLIVLLNRFRSFRQFMVASKYIKALVIVLTAVSVFYQTTAFVKWLDHSGYAAKNAAADLADIVSEDAVLTGPYAPTLTLDNNLHHFIYAFGLEKPDFDIFERFGITHLALDESNMVQAVNDYPRLKTVLPLSEYFLRDRQVLIFRIDTVGEMSDFEKAALFLRNGQIDSAAFYNNSYLDDFPNQRSGMMQKISILIYQKDFNGILAQLDKGLNLYGKDINFLYLAVSTYKRMGKISGRNDLIQLADRLFDNLMILTDNNKALRDNYSAIQ